MAFAISAGTALAIGVGTMAVGSMYSANKAAGAQNKATDAASALGAEQLALSREELAFYKEQYADQKPLQQQAAQTAIDVSKAQLASMQANDKIAQDYYDYQTNTFRPMEKQLVADAQSYDTTERRDAKAASAVADVGMQAQLQRDAMQRSQERMGVNPASGKAMLMQNQMGLAEAAAKAGAGNKARADVETQGWARKMDAASLGRNLASNQATSAGIAINAGNSAVTNAAAPLSQANMMTQTMGQGYNASMAGMSNATSTIVGAHQNTANMWANTAGQMMGAAGTMAGSYFGKK